MHTAKALPQLSVYMPNLNHGHCLPRAIEAVLAQSEYIACFFIVDDGSKDESVQIIQSYAEKNPVIKFIQNTQKKGVIENFADVLNEVQTPYIYGAAADDEVMPGFFKHALTLAKDYPKAALLMGQMATCDAEGRELMLVEISKWTKAQYYSASEFYSDFVDTESPLRSFGCSTIYNTKYLRDLNMKRFASLDHWYDGFIGRILGLKHGVCYMPEVAARWTMQKGSMSQSVIHNTKKTDSIIQETVAWMRSDEFCELFPEEHIGKWSRGYGKFVYWYSSKWVRMGIDAAQYMMRLPVLGPIVKNIEKSARKQLLNLEHS